MNDYDLNSWKEAFSSLPDKQFFNTVRLYLGEVKTPYNKQKLIEALSSFLRKKEIQQNVVSLLCAQDRQIVSCINYVPNMTEVKLADLFRGSDVAPLLHERLVNLEERLSVFRYRNERDGVYGVNPLLDDEIASVVSLDCLFLKTYTR